MTARAGIIYDNLSQSRAGVAGIDLSLFGTPAAGSAASLIDGDSSLPLVQVVGSPYLVFVRFDDPQFLNILALVNHGFTDADDVTVTVYENTNGSGASEIVLTAEPFVTDFDTPYNQYWLFEVTNATIIAQGGPRAVRVEINYTAPPSTPSVGQLVLGSTIIPPHDEPGLKVNYDYGYSEYLTVDRAVNRTIGGQQQAFAKSFVHVIDNIFVTAADETTRRQLVTALSEIAHSRPWLYIPSLITPRCYWVTSRNDGVPISVPTIFTAFDVGPLAFDEQARGFIV